MELIKSVAFYKENKVMLNNLKPKKMQIYYQKMKVGTAFFGAKRQRFYHFWHLAFVNNGHKHMTHIQDYLQDEVHNSCKFVF
jgi:hypothetical protein